MLYSFYLNFSIIHLKIHIICPFKFVVFLKQMQNDAFIIILSDLVAKTVLLLCLTFTVCNSMQM